MRPTAVDHVVVLSGGDPVTADHAAGLEHAAVVIAADSGLSAARVLGLEVDLLVGDLDSVSPADLAEAEDTGVRIDRHPVAKDRTDLAIALDAALEYRPRSLTVVGGHGGRLDHLLANALLLASEAYASTRLVGRFGPAVVTVVRDEVTLTGRAGDLVSLLPVHGPAHGVSTRGLAFPLDDELLSAGSSRGVSNTFTGASAEVRVTAGTLLAVQPGPGDEAPVAAIT